MDNIQKIAVIGAGIGGLTTAALLAQLGYKVTVLEANPYPGGSAATFFHKGYRFDAGATVAGGFQANGPHNLVGEKLGITWPVRSAQTAWLVHLPDRSITVDRNKADILRQFPHSEAFWNEQEHIADIGWSLAAQGLPWPPNNLTEWAQLLRLGFSNFSNGFRVLPYVFSTIYEWLARHKLEQDAAFVRFIDGQLLISAQTTNEYANAMYSATALDLARQGIVHVRGGIGQLSYSLADKVKAYSGEVLYRRRVTGVQMKGGKAKAIEYQVGRHSSKTETLHCDFVVANLTPATLNTLLGKTNPSLLQHEVKLNESGWGAFVLHVGVNRSKLPPNLANHHQIITDWDSPLGEGCSIFVSFSPAWDDTRAPRGHCAVTITTHTDVNQWWNLLQRDKQTYTEYKEQYTDYILTAIDKTLPGFKQSIALILSGTPVTYQYYTGREKGLVGGFPQTSLLKARGPQTQVQNILMVGDSIFPGQSTAGVTVGAMRVANAVNNILT